MRRCAARPTMSRARRRAASRGPLSRSASSEQICVCAVSQNSFTARAERARGPVRPHPTCIYTVSPGIELKIAPFAQEIFRSKWCNFQRDLRGYILLFTGSAHWVPLDFVNYVRYSTGRRRVACSLTLTAAALRSVACTECGRSESQFCSGGAPSTLQHHRVSSGVQAVQTS